MLKKQLSRFLDKNTEAYRQNLIGKVRQLKDGGTERLSDAGGEILYLVFRFQAVVMMVLFLNILFALGINYLLSRYAPEAFEAFGQSAGFLIVFLLYLFAFLILISFRATVTRQLTHVARRPIERRIEGQFQAAEEKISNFNPEDIRLPVKPPHQPNPHQKKQLKRALIATGAGVATFLVLRKVLNKKEKPEEPDTKKKAPETRQAPPATNPIVKALTEVVAEAGKQIALELVRDLSNKKKEAAKPQKPDSK